MNTMAFEQFEAMDNQVLATVEGGGAVGVIGGCVAGGLGGVWLAGPIGTVYGCAAGVGFYNGYKH